MEKVQVIDAVMGAGKTTWALNKIENTPLDEKFIYIAPFLSEVERVIKTVKSRKFVQPTKAAEGGRKLTSLKKQIENGENIAATHALFEMADDELIELLESSNYTLILDEVMDVIEKASVSPSDMRLLLEKGYIKIRDNRVEWIAPAVEYEYGRFDDIKLLAKAGNLFYHRDRFLIWAFPPRIFRTFDNVYVMTYLFDAQIQRYYFDLYNIEYQLNSIKDGELVEYDRFGDNRKELFALIDLYEGDHNRHGEGRTAFSTRWLDRKEAEELQEIQKSITSYVRRVANAKTKDVLWTTLQSVKPFLQGKGYTKGFIPMNMRATNDYADRSVLIYAYNRFMNPAFEKPFFQDNGVTVNEDLLAVSELLQWIWRSRIRNGEPIKLYLPSSRMRSLLKAWANYEI
ncbi:hypothetical protein [Fictibacillus gelatini]|uniref:hypothetical protein n=1 Tax=Fictibacillus gelatini TaxID=225985 RepID=UPI0003F9EF65|nr:hypothetical protein [Fictibacillus gelatini]